MAELYGRQAGRQVIRVSVVASGFNLNCIELTPAATGLQANGTFKIVNRAIGKAIDVIRASTPNGTGIQRCPYTNASNQQWIVTHVGANQYRINSVQTGKSIDEESINKLSGDFIGMYTAASSIDQRWIITQTDSGYCSIRCANSGLVLQVADAFTSNGAIVDPAEYTGATSQQRAFQTP